MDTPGCVRIVITQQRRRSEEFSFFKPPGLELVVTRSKSLYVIVRARTFLTTSLSEFARSAVELANSKVCGEDIKYMDIHLKLAA